MKVSKKSIGVGLLALGLVTTAGAGVTAAAENGFGGERGHRGGHGEIAAQLLGITTDEFQTRVTNGENPRDMLEAAGITKDDMRAAHEQHMQERLAQAVADGRLTQAEADAKIAEREAHQATRDAAHTAIENNDYSAWAAAVAGTPRADSIDASNFSKLVEAHALREAGDHDGARAIMEELGIKPPHGHGGHKGPRGGHTDQ